MRRQDGIVDSGGQNLTQVGKVGRCRSMVYGTMRRHGGEVTVRSAPGQGSLFTLWFPIQTAPAVSTDAARAGGTRPRRILVVDDEAGLVALLDGMLRLDGHEVTTCVSAAQALELCREPRFDLVLTDLSMPTMNGWELARAIRALQPELPLAFLTGWGQTLEAAQLAEVGVSWVLAKPFRREDLQRLVAGATAESRPRANDSGE
jgi:CheY-like chemotaxis protein